MRHNICRFLISLAILSWLPAAVADSELLTLHHNPFSRPEVLRPQPPPPVLPAVEPVLPPEQVELNLTATMVSKNNPMVMVDGELLTIGDRIEGMKLIAVFEGRAVFTRFGKKYSFEITDGLPK